MEQTKAKKLLSKIVWISLAVLVCAAVALLLVWRGLCPRLEIQPATIVTTIPTTQETTVTPDVTPPTITGAMNKTVAVGETVVYKTGVTATDPEDGELPVQVDASAVNAAEPGTYPVVYWAEDAAGNRTEVTVQVEIRPEETTPPKQEAEKPAEKKDYQDYAKQVYKKIVKKGMTEKEKIKAIWSWCHNKISFTSHSKKTDWKTAAYTGFTKLKGDCYIYFATAKALLQEADIPTMDVVKIKKEGRSDHYWLLVKLSGKWYHFDACPRRTANGKTFCLYTDQQMLEFSEAHDDCFDFDLRLYPRTPGKIADKYLIKFYPELFEETPTAPEPETTAPAPEPPEETTTETTKTIDS